MKLKCSVGNLGSNDRIGVLGQEITYDPVAPTACLESIPFFGPWLYGALMVTPMHGTSHQLPDKQDYLKALSDTSDPSLSFSEFDSGYRDLNPAYSEWIHKQWSADR